MIADPKKNRWIGSSADKDDTIDALKLAQLARGGYIKEIHRPVGQQRRFRELMIAYHDAVKSTTRIKNKIKAKFRHNGIQCTGITVYAKSYREEWKAKLPQEPTVRLILDNFWRRLDQCEQTEKELLAAAIEQAKHYPEIKNFEDLPGISFIIAATISAILETPHRFADKKKARRYAGLGIITRSSGGKTYSEKLGKDYNLLLKCVIKQAAKIAIQAKDNPFRQRYLDITLLHGVAPHRAKLTIARDKMATLLAMWRKGEKYNPEIRGKVFHKQV